MLIHVVEALYLIPDWWGVIVAELDNTELRLSPIREVRQNSHTDYEAISDLLRKHELMKVLSARNTTAGCYSMSKQRLVQEARQEISKESMVEQLAPAHFSLEMKGLRQTCKLLFSTTAMWWLMPQGNPVFCSAWQEAIVCFRINSVAKAFSS